MECIVTGKKKVLWIIILSIAVVVFTACSIYFIVDYFHYRSMTNIGKTDFSNSSSTVETEKIVPVPVNFDELKTVNDDIYAWIRIPIVGETDKYIVDYPVLQSKSGEDRSYYLNHNVNKKTSVYGAIYTENYNTKSFNDFNTLIYGHNMKNGTMFGSLKKYRNQEFFEKNNEIFVYMPNRILKYHIFGAYVFDDRHIMLSFDFDNESERRLYLDTVFAKKNLASNFAQDIEVNTDDKIITLSTCTNNDSERYLVQGVLVYDSETDS